MKKTVTYINDDKKEKDTNMHSIQTQRKNIEYNREIHKWRQEKAKNTLYTIYKILKNTPSVQQ